jgi:hypothetical protein
MRVFTSIILFFLLSIIVSAQQRNIRHKAPPKLDEPATAIEKKYLSDNFPLSNNYIPVETMTNAYSFAQIGITPLYFDPYSGVLALVHRGWADHYAKSSGEIWYNISTDFGISWSRVPGSINGTQLQTLGRYPTMSISNPTKGPISATRAFFVWPELKDANNIGWLGYGADQPVGLGSPYSALDKSNGDYSTQMMAWADDKTQEVFWTSGFYPLTDVDAHIKLFKTDDFATIDTLNPPQWGDSVFENGGNIGIGGCAFNGVQYVGAIGTFNATLVPNPPPGGFLVGYSKSTDQGKTWSSFKMADWRNITKFSHYETLFDFIKTDDLLSYQGSMGVDKNNHVHIIVSVTDTTTDIDNGTNSIIDIFETDAGWDGTIVYSGLNTAYSSGPGLGLMGPNAELAFDSTHSVMAIQFINTPASGTRNDLFLTYKGITDSVWSTPVNMTNSAATINNTSAHLAPCLKKDGYQYTAFSAFCYSPIPYDSTYDGNNTAVLYCAPYSFTYGATGVNDHVNALNNFNLFQNYPNPFNPGTTITYSLPQKNNVSLKVYDVLGREIANLVDAMQEAGSHSVNFNASKLASGLYIYTLRSGNNIISKKMMLMK